MFPVANIRPESARARVRQRSVPNLHRRLDAGVQLSSSPGQSAPGELKVNGGYMSGQRGFDNDQETVKAETGLTPGGFPPREMIHRGTE